MNIIELLINSARQYMKYIFWLLYSISFRTILGPVAFRWAQVSLYAHNVSARIAQSHFQLHQYWCSGAAENVRITDAHAIAPTKIAAAAAAGALAIQQKRHRMPSADDDDAGPVLRHNLNAAICIRWRRYTNSR